MDAFYASVEVLDHPELAGLPVIVGGTPDGRGVVAAASYPARKFGVHSAMSAARARRLCPGAVFIAPRMERYAEVSRRIREIFGRYTPQIEPISLDEAFLDVTGSRRLFGDAEQIGRTIKKSICDELNLVASVGVAPNKFLAKLGSDLDKPDGFVVIDARSARDRIAHLPVGRIWGVGRKALVTLQRLGVHTVSELAAIDPGTLEAHFGAGARRLQALARGEDDRAVVAHATARGLSAETTFSEDLDDAAQLRARVDSLSDRVARRVRQHGYAAHTITLKARYANFQTVTRSRTLPHPTQETAWIRTVARELLEVRLGRRGRALRLLGVGASGLVRTSELSGALFDDPYREREQQIDRVMDSLRDRFGSGAIQRGSTRDRTPSQPGGHSGPRGGHDGSGNPGTGD